MKKGTKIIGLASASLLMLTGCGKIPTLSNGEEAVTTFEGIDGISTEALYQDLKEAYGINALITMIDKQIYEKEYASLLVEATEYADNYTAAMIENYGGEDAFLSEVQSSFGTIAAYTNYLYVSYLQNIAVEDYSKSLITDAQVEKYYEEESIGDMEISHILITSDALSSSTSEEVAEFEAEAKAQVESIIKELNTAAKNGEDIEELFAELAKEHSQDTATSYNGGDLGRINFGELEYTYDELISAAKSLDDGEYSTSVITTELGFHIILKTKSYEKESMEDLKESIIETLASNELMADQYIILDALVFYRDKYEMNIIDDDLAKEYATYIKNLEAQIASMYEGY